MKVLVTGGAGFIGSNLVRGLLARGHAVRVLDNFAAGKRANLEAVKADVEVLEGDIRDAAVCANACAGIEVVFHQAAVGSVPLSIEDPITNHKVNVDGTLNVLLAARDRGVRRLMFASSSSLYGDAPELVKAESLPARPLSPYAVSKLAGETYANVFHNVYGLETVSLRYFNIFGPRQDPNSMYAAVIPRFVSALLEHRGPRIFGDGEQTRDFTFVENVVHANLLAMTCPNSSCGRAYNVACGASTSLNELYALIQRTIGGSALSIKPRFEAPQKGDVRNSLASIEDAARALGYTIVVKLDEGIAKTVDWYRSTIASKETVRA